MDVLESIKPTRAEELKAKKIVSKFLAKLNKRLVGGEAVVGGSFAKNTWLKGDHDIDIFVLFGKKQDTNKISEILEKTIKQVFLFVNKIAGSRDYFQIKYKGYLFELIPVLKIDNPEEALNIMDISPMHVSWVNKNINGKEDDVRKLKMFMKAANCYGAESYIKGFSGYVLELLLAYYKTFSRLSKAAHKWTDKTIIDIERHYTRNEVLARLNQSKIQSPLIVVDPTWPERNAAAALSKESFEGFKKACLEYVKKPSTKFFDMKKFDLKKELNRYNPKDCFVLEMTPSLSNRDIEGTKVLKIYEKIYRRLKDQGFEIRRSGWQFDEKAVVWFVVKNGKLSRNEKHYGPPKKLEKAIEILVK